MCCIFTCCGWLIDLIQRIWTFTMSCCISSAVCCALVTASVSGIALGYNYSLAEYIDLKETNVTVYMKRGIFADKIKDMEARRSGHLPVAGHIDESNLRSGESENELASVVSGRRLDDYIYESDSDDRNKFEGSLMKLTATAPAPSHSTESETTIDMYRLNTKHSMASVDQMKTIKTLVNMRKFADSVSREPINDPYKWSQTKLPTEAFIRGKFGEYEKRPTNPASVTPRAGPVRPTRSKPTGRPRTSLTTASVQIIDRREYEPSQPKPIDEEMDTFKEKFLWDKHDEPSFKDEDSLNYIKGARREDEDYEDVAKDVSRKKRATVDSTFNTNESFKYISSINNTKNNFEDHDANKTTNFLLNFKGSLINLLSKERIIISNNEFVTSIEQENNTISMGSRTSSLSSNIVLRLLNLSTTTF